MMTSGDKPKAIVAKRGYTQISDTGAIDVAIDRVLAANADAVARYKAGNANVLGALVGMTMKETGGKANPKVLNELIREKLKA